MYIPNIAIENIGIWDSPQIPTYSRPRVVLRYELECYLGETGECWIDGVRYELKRNTVLFAQPGQIRSSRYPFSVRYIYFELQEPSPEFEAWLSDLPAYLPPSESAAQITEQLEKEYTGNSYAARLACQTLLLQSLLALSASEPQSVAKQLHPMQTEVFRVIRYMKEHIYGTIGVGELAALSGYSAPYLNKFFREVVGRSPYEYYIGLKMLEARRLLLSGERNVTQIAGSLCFSSGSHFCTAFRKTFGQTPKQFVDSFRGSNTLPDEIT